MKLYKELVQNYGSPLYVYNLNKITTAYEMLKNCLPENSKIFYSLKANPNPGVVHHIIKLGCYAEISSIRELDIVLAAGLPVHKCLYTGPGKSDEEIKHAMEKGVSHFSVESLDELGVISNLSLCKKSKVRITLRINPSSQSSNASINMTGIPSQFGFEEDQLDSKELMKFKNNFIVIEGIHIYNGSNFDSSEKLFNNFKSAIHTIKRVSRRLEIDLKFIDLGGGFSAPYGKNETLINYKDIKTSLQEIIDNEFSNDIQIAFETGRYLTATSGVIIGTVQSLKKSKERNFCIIDFGINNLGGMSGLRRLPSSNFNIIPIDKANEEKIEASLVGPLCTPLDYIDKKAIIPRFSRGDNFFIPNVGAYGLTASLLGFLSRDFPKEIIIENNDVRQAFDYKLISLNK